MKIISGEADFAKQAARVLALRVEHRVNALGGYGPGGEVIYEAHPVGCPSVLVISKGNAEAAFMSNGSVSFNVKLKEGLDVNVLSGSFDAVEKHETGPLSGGLWLSVPGALSQRVAALVNPQAGLGCPPERIKIVKLGEPARAMWHCAWFAPTPGVSFCSAIRHTLVLTRCGPALLRQAFLLNSGRKTLKGGLWSYFHLHGTQRFVYNKEIWYDAGLPVASGEIVVAATVPHSDIVQIKRVSTSASAGLAYAEATCDYSAFIGNSGACSILPQAVVDDALLPGAGRKLNRFTIATIAAERHALHLAPQHSAVLQQSLLYVTDERLVCRFRRKIRSRFPDYRHVAAAFLAAAKGVISTSPDARQVAAIALAAAGKRTPPAFDVVFPNQRVITEYARSVWTGVPEIYEHCRAHGAKLAEGIELGTRDRAQDMWPMLKIAPERVRADLVHALGFMYVTNASGSWSRPLTLVQKLHGMYPRQFPSRWDKRANPVANDNRPYSDSPLWLVNSLAMYIRETGDHGILQETVSTVRLTDPENPEKSAMIGCALRQTVGEAMLEILACFERHLVDSPYGMAQIMHGEWCDPVDMFGTSVVGDTATRGRGRGTQTRLSAHLFLTLVEAIDLLEALEGAGVRTGSKIRKRLASLKKTANDLRRNIVRFAWEPPAKDMPGAFVGAIHELRCDGSRPDYRRGQTGYTLGSIHAREFDGIPRRELTSQAYGLAMLRVDRPYLQPVPSADRMIAEIFATVDRRLYADRLGLRLFSVPVANNEISLARVGRMGILPAGCAENGEYHHAQVMMHLFRLLVPNQADRVWNQFKQMISAMRDESLAGPFEMPSTSYASDRNDPHFGKGMYFGLSGSIDWIVELLQNVAGLELALHDKRRPALRVTPRLPTELGGQLIFQRTIHAARPQGGFRTIPLRIEIQTTGKGPRIIRETVALNGRQSDAAVIQSLDGLRVIDLKICRVLA